MKITNEADVSLPLAVWLLHDDYDYIAEENYISVTRLMRPIRHLIIPPRIPIQERQADVADFISRALGHSIHDSIEKAWINNPHRKLKLLGYPDKLIERVVVNPTIEQRMAQPDMIPVYLEQRQLREFNGWKIGGKFDLCAEGIVNDNKSTSAFAWVNGTRDDEHILQMSLYRWIDAFQEHPIITEDFCQVHYIFTDWQKAQAKQNPKYPQKRVESKTLQLLSLEQTEDYVRGKLAQYEQFKNTPEPNLPLCTDEELWRSDPQYKYYSDPEKAKDPNARSTKNFPTKLEAERYRAEKGKGVVITKPGEVKRCAYCDAFDGCTQKDQYQ